METSAMNLSAPRPEENSNLPVMRRRDDRPYSINLILMTLRSGETACDIVEAGLLASLRHAGVRLTVAYGGSDPQHAAWLAHSIDAADARGAEVRLICETDIRARLRLAIDSSKTWVLFLADDDVFSLNYLSSLARRSLTVGPEVATIAPTAYLGVASGQTMARWVKPLLAGTAPERLALHLAEPALHPVLYYALQRSVHVGTWLDYLETRHFAPSYVDQLLTFWCASHGDRVVVEEPAMQLRDEANWIDLDACATSDARFYPLPAMTLFHELFWAADLCRLMRRHTEFEALLPMLYQCLESMLSRLIMRFDQRRQALRLAGDEEHLLMLRAVATVVQWLQGVASGPEFNSGLFQVQALAEEVERAFLEGLQDRGELLGGDDVDLPGLSDLAAQRGEAAINSGAPA